MAGNGQNWRNQFHSVSTGEAHGNGTHTSRTRQTRGKAAQLAGKTPEYWLAVPGYEFSESAANKAEPSR